MSDNPYSFGDDVDDDLFEDLPTAGPIGKNNYKHSIDGSLCTSCGIVHGMPDVDFSKLGDRMQKAMQDLLENLPAELAAQLTADTPIPVHASLITTYHDFLCSSDRRNAEGPMLRAVIVLLDQMTDGRATKLWKVFEAERRVMVNHSALKQVNNIVEELRPKLVKGEDGKEPSKLKAEINSLELLCAFTKERIAVTVEDYMVACEAIDMQPSDDIIKTGVLPENMDPIERLIMNMNVNADILDLDVRST